MIRQCLGNGVYVTYYPGAKPVYEREQNIMSKVIQKPEIVCLCGSTRFLNEYAEANRRLTIEGKIVLSIGSQASNLTPEEKTRADKLHLHKIEMANRVHILNVGGYVGQSTQREIAFAIAHEKRFTWSDPTAGAQYLVDNWDALAALMASF
jgi:hypothetical protein